MEKKMLNLIPILITTFSGNIGLPCIIFYSLTFSDIDFDVFLRFSAFTLIYVGIFSVNWRHSFKVLKQRYCSFVTTINSSKYWKYGNAFMFICFWYKWISNCNSYNFNDFSSAFQCRYFIS